MDTGMVQSTPEETNTSFHSSQTELSSTLVMPSQRPEGSVIDTACATSCLVDLLALLAAACTAQ